MFCSLCLSQVQTQMNIGRDMFLRLVLSNFYQILESQKQTKYFWEPILCWIRNFLIPTYPALMKVSELNVGEQCTQSDSYPDRTDKWSCLIHRSDGKHGMRRIPNKHFYLGKSFKFQKQINWPETFLNMRYGGCGSVCVVQVHQ